MIVTFACCLFFSLEYGILIGAGVNLAMLLHSTSRPRIINQQVVVKFAKMFSAVLNKFINKSILKGDVSNYLLITPDRSLSFTAVDFFMSSVRKYSALHREPVPLPIVMDLKHVYMVDFSASYVSIDCICTT